MHEINETDTVLFDLDGTLTDSGPGIIHAVGYATEKLGLPSLTEEERSLFVGPPLREMFAKRFQLSFEESTEAVRVFREYYVPMGVYENSLYDGVEPMLRRLKDEGLRLIVCTSKPEHLAEKVLSRFGIRDYFDIVAGAELSGKYTEKLAIIDRLVEQNTLGNAVMVGDRKFDVEAGHHIGALAVAVTWGYAGSGEWDEFIPDYVVHSPAELADLLLGGN